MEVSLIKHMALRSLEALLTVMPADETTGPLRDRVSVRGEIAEIKARSILTGDHSRVFPDFLEDIPHLDSVKLAIILWSG